MIRRLAGPLLIVLAAAVPARGQGPPIVASVEPPGGQAGTTVAWTIAGRGLATVENLLVSGSGVKVVSLVPDGEEKAVATVAIAKEAAPGFRELRVEGPRGVSNLAIVRIDTLPQAAEDETHGATAKVQTMAVGSAVAGRLRFTDVDRYRIEGTPGREITLDFEARRLGTAISPVLSALNSRGVSIAQARESRSGDHDARLAVKFPRDGVLIAEVRDNTYGGGPSAVYRLRATTAPFTTGMFPLGGEAGKALTIVASGGSLKGVLSKTVALPDRAGELIDPGPLGGADGLVDAPMRVMVGEADHPPPCPPAQGGRVENLTPGEPKPSPLVGGGPTPIRIGQTIDGRIAKKGAVDRYAMTVKRGDTFRLRVVAEPMGSWLDSVLTVRGKDGNVLAEDDDSTLASDAASKRGVSVLGVSEGTTDSLLDFTAGEDGPITVEVADRYGDGGPEFGYRLSAGASRADVTCVVLMNANAEALAAASGGRMAPTPGMFGVYNLRLGQRVPVNFLVLPQGRPGPVTVRVEGLPDGVSAESVTVDVLGPGAKGGHPEVVDAPPRAGLFVLEVSPHASPGLGTFRVVASAEPEPGRRIERTASATIGVGAASTRARPVTRRVEGFPIRVLGKVRRRFVGPPAEPRLIEVKAPGVLLQGDRVELTLGFDGSPVADPGFAFEGRVEGDGLATSTAVVRVEDEDEPPETPVVRVTAAPEARPGVHTVSISYRMTGGQTRAVEALVIVRTPAALLARSEDVAIAPGESAEVWVGVRREVGCVEEVDVRIEGLPAGVRQATPLSLGPDDADGVVRLEMAKDASPTANPTTVRVVGVVRMVQGVVRIDAGNRPRILARSAEGKG